MNLIITDFTNCNNILKNTQKIASSCFYIVVFCEKGFKSMNPISSIQNTSVLNGRKTSVFKQNFSGKKNSEGSSINKKISEHNKIYNTITAVVTLLGLAFAVTCGILGAKESKSPTLWGKFKDGCKMMWDMLKSVMP